MSSLFSNAYKRYALSMFTLTCAINVLDRGLIILLLQPIKEDLHLSDANLGFLTGIAFSFFYATLGVPIARWADRGNRVTIISLALGLWSATVMMCMFVASFPQMVAARIAAAVGEAGGMPPTYSLLGDYFRGSVERTRAMSIYMLSDPAATLVSFIVGGWLNAHFGWRIAFFSMGLPGLVVAILVRLTVVEPRLSTGSVKIPEKQLPRMAEVLRTLWHQRSSRHLTIGLILFFAVGTGLTPWEAAFLMRSYGMGTAALGVWLGLIFSLGGMVGILSGGYVANRWFVGNEQGQMRMGAVAMATTVPLVTAFLLAPRKEVALFALVPMAVMFNLILGPLFALMQRLVVDDIRATTMAVVMLLANLIGMGVGPQVVGSLSDLLRPALGSESLRYAMLAMSLVAFWSAYHFWLAGRTVKEDLFAVAGPNSTEVELCLN